MPCPAAARQPRLLGRRQQGLARAAVGWQRWVAWSLGLMVWVAGRLVIAAQTSAQQYVDKCVPSAACPPEQNLLTLLQATTGGQQRQQQQQQEQQQEQQDAASDEGPKENSNPAAAAAGGSGSAATCQPGEVQPADTGAEHVAAQPAQPAKRPRLALRK